MNFITQLFDSSERFRRKYAEQILNRFQCLPCPGARVALQAQWIEPRGLSAALAREARVALTGAAGAGKTTTLAWLAATNARRLLAQADAPVPLFFAGRDLRGAALPRLTDLRDLNLSQELAAQCPTVFFPGVLRAGRALVLLDDADALPPEQLQAWLREFKDARIVIAAASPLPGFAEFPLPGFRDSDIVPFARKWNAANADAFLAALKANAVPRALTANPMTLTLLAHVWRADQNLPTRRAELFDRFAANGLGDMGETAKMLEGVALAIQRGKPASNEFLARARGFLRAGKNRTVEFTHELWQAYFAARALRQAPDLQPVLEHLSDASWRQVVLFYAGLGDASALVDALLALGEVDLAGHAVAHAQQVRAELSALVTQELMRRAWEGEAPAIAALGALSSDGAVDAFAAKLKDKDPAVRTRAADILGRLQLDRGIEYLLPQLRDVNADVRDKVVEALGHARTDRVIEPLLVALRGDPRVGTVDTRLRVAAAKALGEIASDKAAPALIVDLQLGEPEVRAVAAQALARMTSPLLLKPLQSILQSGDAAARKYAAEILAVADGYH